jgi:hypothetical protein
MAYALLAGPMRKLSLHAGRQGDRLRLLFGLQPRLRLLLRLLLRVQLRVGP